MVCSSDEYCSVLLSAAQYRSLLLYTLPATRFRARPKLLDLFVSPLGFTGEFVANEEEAERTDIAERPSGEFMNGERSPCVWGVCALMCAHALVMGGGRCALVYEV